MSFEGDVYGVTIDQGLIDEVTDKINLAIELSYDPRQITI